MKIAMFSIPLLLISVLSFSCAKAVITPKDTIIENPTPATLPQTVNKTVMLQLINKARTTGCQCGDTYYYPVGTVTWNIQLELAAYNHSSDMYKNNYFSHIAADGTNGGVRIEKAGYKWLAYGENIGAGYKNEKEVIEAWLKSPTHCKNIMSQLYKEVGVAKVGTYWTQDFGSK
jgi:uncharacterized protein YkwD